MSKLIACLAVIAALSLAGCRAAPMFSPSDIAFAAPPTTVVKVLTMEDYKNAILLGGVERGWTFQEVGPGHLVGEVAVRNKHFASVDIYFDTESISISYKSSVNLNYNAGRNEIHPNYNSWITNLLNDIQAEVTRMKAS